MNNFNTCSYMEDIEFNISYDNCISQHDFDECFIRIEEGFFQYVDFGNIEPIDADDIPGDYEIIEIQGYSQGDFAKVLTPKSLSNREHFINLFYSSPLYISLTIDGEEDYTLQDFSGVYEYDKDAITEHIKKSSLSDTAKAWIIERLPEYPEYV